ncbi:MAG: hypothetical protein C5B49_07275 [Bdellovibrio sp.]|nr:MAG: hypothetical protein C5B49_07275 [Bdellovibrio sp.]
MTKFIEWLIEFQRRKPILFFALLFSFLGWGMYVALQSEIEAFPELTNVQVQVITQYPGKASEEVERKITVPLEVATNGLPGLMNQRSLSIFGLSVITLTFEDKVESKQARIDVAQRLNDAELPEGVKASLSPDSTPLGEIFRYTLKGDLPVDEMRLIEDWRLEREFKSIPGVADVVSFGGPVRTIEVKLDIPRLKAFGLSVSSVAQALGQNHANAGGSIIRHGDESYIVRSIGLYESPESLVQAVVATQKGIPIRIRDLGSVHFGTQPRLGQVAFNGNDDVVEGIILMRKGADTVETCEQIREKIAKLNDSVLPKGVQVIPYYDRTDLIERSSHTVFHNVIMGIFLVCVVLILGLGLAYWPISLGVAAIIPFALMIAFVGMRWAGYAPNLISLGAVDFGIIVETAIFAAEAVIVAIAARGSKQPPVVKQSIAEVLQPAFLCALLLLIAFVPILSLQQVEGRIFKPLGITLISALLGGQLGALIFVPLAAAFLPAQAGADKTEHFFAWILMRCEIAVRSLINTPALFAKSVVFFLVVLGLLVWGLGREFLPQFNEGSLYIRTTAPQTIAREASVALAKRIHDRLKTIPEVVDTVSQVGRPDDGTDVNGFDNIETLVSLKDPHDWQSARTIDGFVALAQNALKDIAGVSFNFSQPIKDNVDEAVRGSKGSLWSSYSGRTSRSSRDSPVRSRRSSGLSRELMTWETNSCWASRNFASP